MEQFEYDVSLRLGDREVSALPEGADLAEVIRQAIVGFMTGEFGVPEHTVEGHGSRPYPSVTVKVASAVRPS